jgi:hypothetical protein
VQPGQASHASNAPARAARAARTPPPPSPPAVAIAAHPVVAIPPTPTHRACDQCQSELREDAMFCGQCGAVFTLG